MIDLRFQPMQQRVKDNTGRPARASPFRKSVGAGYDDLERELELLVARNIGIDSRWDGHMYLRGLGKADRANIMAARIESHAPASVWTPRTKQMNFQLLG